MGTTMGKFQKLSRSGVSLGPGSKQLSSDLKFRSEENIYSTTSISHSLASNSTGGSDTSRTKEFCELVGCVTQCRRKVCAADHGQFTNLLTLLYR